MPKATINGIEINYLTVGEGPPLLLLAPGGFRSVISRWTSEGGKGVFREMDALNTLAKHFHVIAYDRRESGQSGGRIETLSWALYADEATGLLDLLGVSKAFVLGGCMGASLAMTIAHRHPDRCAAMILHWPVGGYRWMSTMHEWFERHIRYVKQHGLPAVIERSRTGDNFFLDPEMGPWGSPTLIDAAFSHTLVNTPTDHYLELVKLSCQSLFPDTLPSGPGGAELISIQTPARVVSGNDWAHTRSAAFAITELMPNATLWDCPAQAQTAPALLAEILAFTALHTQRLEH
jgi:pimeloyl-ACP methyl ester carboxylesterase